jgi:hypothetical protein
LTRDHPLAPRLNAEPVQAPTLCVQSATVSRLMSGRPEARVSNGAPARECRSGHVLHLAPAAVNALITDFLIETPTDGRLSAPSDPAHRGSTYRDEWASCAV